MISPLRIRIVVAGASWGGIEAATQVFAALPADFPAPVVLVQHQRISAENRLAELLSSRTPLRVVTPQHGEKLQPGTLYVAPPGYHALIEETDVLALGMHWPVHYCRPAIDELFFSAGQIYGRGTLGLILTGANEDGAEGIRYISRRGGVTVVQDPATAEAPIMPKAAIALGGAQYVVPLQDIGQFLNDNTFGLRE